MISLLYMYCPRELFIGIALIAVSAAVLTGCVYALVKADAGEEDEI